VRKLGKGGMTHCKYTVQDSQNLIEFDIEMEEDINVDDIEDGFENYLQE